MGRKNVFRRFTDTVVITVFIMIFLPATLNVAWAGASFERIIFATLDDADEGVRGQGWYAIGILGSLSNPNPLVTLRFLTFVRENEPHLNARIIALATREHIAGADDRQDANSLVAADREVKEFTDVAKSVPEIAVLAVKVPEISRILTSADLKAIEEEAARNRPGLALQSLPENTIQDAIATIFSSAGSDDTTQAEATDGLFRTHLSQSDLDRLDQVAADGSRSLEVRSKVAVILAQNGRAPGALAVAELLQADPSNSQKNRSNLLDILTALTLAKPAVGKAAILAQAKPLTKFLSDTSLLVSTSALLGQLDDEVADDVSMEILKRLESGDGLAGSSCIYAQIMNRSPKWPIELAYIARAVSDDNDRTQIAGCVAMLASSSSESAVFRSIALDLKLGNPDERRAVLTTLDREWGRVSLLDSASFYKIAEGSRRLLVGQAAHLVDALPLFSFHETKEVGTWRDRAEPFGLASSFSRAYWTRWVATRTPMVAGTLGLWFVALVSLVLMSHSRSLRAFLLFHPLGRQVGAFGQVNALVFAVPSLRRQFFRPYRASMLGALAQQEARSPGAENYFSGSGVAELQRGGIAAQLREFDRRTLTGSGSKPTVVETFRGWQGRVMLIGPSGRGKTMFLKHHLFEGKGIREPAIFATAGSLGTRPIDSIAAKLASAIPDEGFLDALISSGRLDLYVDGLNEVDPETRAAIIDFIAARPGANFFVTTQPLERYPADARLFALLPLTRDQLTEFLVTRESTLPPNARLLGDIYRGQSKAFVAEKLAEADAEGTEIGADSSERARALIERLSNPMDLQTIAELLSLGQRPDVWGLQRQRHEIVDQIYRERTNNDQFPLLQFSRSVYEARRDGTSEIDDQRFPRLVDILLEQKQVQRYVIANPDFKSDGFVFRHDKIRDFYTYNAFISDPSLRALHAGDDQFAGIYELLPLELPTLEALELREMLLERSVDKGDHRLSDRYLEGLRARRILSAADPDWLARFDRPEIEADNRALGKFEAQRLQVVEQINRTRVQIDASRAGTRIICSARTDALLEATSALFAEAGIHPAGVGSAQRSLFRTPAGFQFGVLGLASYKSLPAPLIEGLKTVVSTFENQLEPTLVVVNAEADLPPVERTKTEVEDARRSLSKGRLVVCNASDLLSLIRASPEIAADEITSWWALS
ncbi:hypothetical protein [Rhizobium ruizarguesonis]|uniref:hypothetical protein n=1 Tax=Rhizobium ruizarguesonis TaxID=2081791 RepID=UPI0013B78950|nr:hypothetical protein [Rhizobium ruizarguesonis]NEH61729.1 hypothetical protein [Rhizobium ruizarguesonis]